MKKKEIDRRYYESLPSGVCPRDQGQIVELSYAVDEDGLYTHIHDRSDGSEEITFRRYRKNAKEKNLRFEPQNGIVPRAKALAGPKIKIILV